MRLVPPRSLTTAMLEIIMGRIGSRFFQISQNRVGTLYRKVPQKAATTFPQFQVGHLQKILDQGPGWLAPPGCSAHYCEADRPAHTGKELLPCLIAAPVGAETDDLGQGQGRITCHFKSVQHSARCGYQWSICRGGMQPVALRFEHASRLRNWMIVSTPSCKNSVMTL